MTQPLTDAEEISRTRFLGSALNMPWNIGSQKKIILDDKELDQHQMTIQ